MDSIKFPIEYDLTGLKKLTDDTDDYYKQLLTMTARTEPGVQKVYPEFGVFDPTFNTIDRGQFLVSAARYVPEVRILAIEADDTDSGRSVTFSFTRRS
jgi:hypothetical protein